MSLFPWFHFVTFHLYALDLCFGLWSVIGMKLVPPCSSHDVSQIVFAVFVPSLPLLSGRPPWTLYLNYPWSLSDFRFQKSTGSSLYCHQHWIKNWRWLSSSSSKLGSGSLFHCNPCMILLHSFAFGRFLFLSSADLSQLQFLAWGSASQPDIDLWQALQSDSQTSQLTHIYHLYQLQNSCCRCTNFSWMLSQGFVCHGSQSSIDCSASVFAVTEPHCNCPVSAVSRCQCSQKLLWWVWNYHCSYRSLEECLSFGRASGRTDGSRIHHWSIRSSWRFRGHAG